MLRVLGGFVAVVAVVTVVVCGGYLAGWWLQADATNRQGQINEQSYGAQQSRLAELHQDITTVLAITSQIADSGPAEQAPLKAQRGAVLSQACAAAAQLTTVPADVAPFVAANCADGTGSPSSPYAP